MSVQYFSGFEVIRAAMEVEKNGHRFYSGMAERAVNPTVKELFAMLAQDEVEHLRRLKGLESKYSEGAFFENEEEFLPYLQRFRDSEVFPSEEILAGIVAGPALDLKALDLAIEAEEKFAAYFKTAADNARDAGGQEAFRWLAGEEERHAAILKERKQKVAG
jgi:rubrerythrin